MGSDLDLATALNGWIASDPANLHQAFRIVADRVYGDRPVHFETVHVGAVQGARTVTGQSGAWRATATFAWRANVPADDSDRGLGAVEEGEATIPVLIHAHAADGPDSLAVFGLEPAREQLG